MKISIVGAGRLGSLIGFLIADRGLADEIVLVDINAAGAEGQALDLSHSFLKSGKAPKITSGGYIATIGSDIVIITAGKPRTAAMSSRAELLAENAKIIRSVCAEVKQQCKSAILITTTNPVDAINYIAWKETGFPRERLIGFGGLLDSSRLKTILFEEISPRPKSISCDVVGEHGENMIPVFSRVQTDGTPAYISAGQKERIKGRLLGIAKEVIAKKGATEYGPASNLLRIVEAIVNNKRESLLCSCILNGEYSLNDVSLGVSAVIGKNGIEKIDELLLDFDELGQMTHAGKKVRAEAHAALDALNEN